MNINNDPDLKRAIKAADRIHARGPFAAKDIDEAGEIGRDVAAIKFFLQKCLELEFKRPDDRAC